MMIRVLVNNEFVNCKKEESLLLLISQQLHNLKGIAVAVNNQVIPKKNWETHLLNEHDKITIIHATQGG